MTWQLLTLISVLTFSVSVLLRRLLLHEDKSDPIAYVVVFQALVGILTGVYALFQGFEMPDLGQLWFPILLTIALYSMGHLVSARALQIVEASVFSVLFATGVFWTMAVGVVFFSESLSVIKLAGVLLLLVSIFILIEKKGDLKLDRGIILGLLTGVLFGLAVGGWAYVGRYTDNASWTSLSFLGPALMVLLMYPRSVKKMKPFLKGSKLSRMLLLGLAMGISSLAAMAAFQQGNISVVAALQQTSIIVTTLLGIVFLHERTRLWQKLLAAVICFIGVLLII